jgi:hypothetical protein
MSICALLFANVNWFAVIAAAVAQHFFSYFYYAMVISEPFSRLMARDKGVTGIMQCVMRYTMWKCVLISFLASICRALFIVGALNMLKLDVDANCAVCAYIDAGLLVSAVTLIANHMEFWSQRHLGLQSLEVIGDVLSAVLASLVLYNFKI